MKMIFSIKSILKGILQIFILLFLISFFYFNAGGTSGNEVRLEIKDKKQWLTSVSKDIAQFLGKDIFINIPASKNVFYSVYINSPSNVKQFEMLYDYMLKKDWKPLNYEQLISKRSINDYRSPYPITTNTKILCKNHATIFFYGNVHFVDIHEDKGIQNYIQLDYRKNSPCRAYAGSEP